MELGCGALGRPAAGGEPVAPALGIPVAPGAVGAVEMAVVVETEGTLWESGETVVVVEA